MSPSIRITVTVPKEILNISQVRSSIENTMHQKTAPELRAQFRKTTEGWQTKVDFSQKFSFGQAQLSTQVYSSGGGANTYALVNAGSPAHTITRRRSPLLRFQPGYVPATTPRVIGSRRSRRFGNVITPLSVQHPGFKAREFDDSIAEAYTPVFERDMQDAINRGSQ